MIYLISCNPGLVPLPKSSSLSEIYKSPVNDICSDCRIVRPPRARHCYYCNRCVYRYDHHCQWVNNCIGINNNSLFFMFLFTLLILCVIVDYIAVEVYIAPKDDGLSHGKFAIPAASIIIFLSTCVMYPVAMLFIIQVKNFSNNLTSNERLSKGRKNAVKRGCWLSNCVKMCNEKPGKV